MTCCVCITSPVQPRGIVISIGNDMEQISQFNPQSLLPAERSAFTARMGAMLAALGSLLQEHPALCSELSPETGEFLVTIGEKLVKVSHHFSV